MRKTAVINQKGGVGKTTTTANLAAAIARRGQRVLLVDLDPQAHLSLHLGAEAGDDQPTVLDLLTGDAVARDVIRNVRENLSIIPAHTCLAAAETLLATVDRKELRLATALESVSADYDWMLIDCPPALGVLTINALAASDRVLIPLQPHFFGLQGLGKLLETVLLVRDRINSELTVDGVVICMHEPSTKLATEVVEDLFSFFENARGTDLPWARARVYRNFIRRNIKLAEASSYGQTVFDYAPKSNGAVDYEELAKEMLGEADTEASPADEVAPVAPASHSSSPARRSSTRGDARSQVA